MKGPLEATVDREGPFAKVDGDMDAQKPESSWKLSTPKANFRTLAEKSWNQEQRVEGDRARGHGIGGG